jgi:hypothetical protein
MQQKYGPAADLDFGPLEALLGPLALAEDAVSRLDEHARIPLAEGLKARLEFREACAWAWNRGELVHLEDLVLHDDSLDIRTPDPELTRAHAMLRMWRRTGRLKPSELLSPEGVLRLIGRGRASRSNLPSSPMPAARLRTTGNRSALGVDEDEQDAREREVRTPIDVLISQAERVTTEDDAEALAAWFELQLTVPTKWPALLRASVLLEAWSIIDPLPRHSYMGVVLVNALLVRDRRLRRHRLNVELGRRRLMVDGYRRPEGQSGLRRTVWWLRAFAAGEEAAQVEFDRLSLAHQVVARHLTGRRASSRLADVVTLFASKPIVTAPMIAHHLKISQQAARTLVRSLGGGVTEITGRRRFQAWRL